jgi:hypothetical protein
MSKNKAAQPRMTAANKWLREKAFARKCVRARFPLDAVRAEPLSFGVEIRYAKPSWIFIFVDWQFLCHAGGVFRRWIIFRRVFAKKACFLFSSVLK